MPAQRNDAMRDRNWFSVVSMNLVRFGEEAIALCIYRCRRSIVKLFETYLLIKTKKWVLAGIRWVSCYVALDILVSVTSICKQIPWNNIWRNENERNSNLKVKIEFQVLTNKQITCTVFYRNNSWRSETKVKPPKN